MRQPMSASMPAPISPRESRVAAAGLALLLAALAAPTLGAQERRASTLSMELTPYAGYMMLGELVRGPYGTDVSGSNGLVLGGQLAVRLTPNVAVVGNVARAEADLQVGLPIVGGFGIGTASVWMYDAGLELGVPATTAGGVGVAPFVQAGAGAMRHTVGASFLRTTATNFAGNVGVGADLMLGPSIGIRLLARDYIGRFDVEEASGFGVENELSHNLSFSAGVKLRF